MKEGGMQIVDCNNHVKSATEFFGSSCAVNCLTDKYNPIGDNSDKLCRICIGKVPGGKCTDSDPYAGFEGAFRCLVEAGDVAFLKHTTVEEQLSGMEFSFIPRNKFELLCTDGSRRSINDYQNCNWGIVPGNAIVATSATLLEDRKKYQKFLQKVVEMYSNRYQTNTTFGYDLQNENNNNRNDYDQYENRNRFKRQFGNFDHNTSSRDNYDSYSNRDQNANTDQTSNRDAFNRDLNDPFAKDPYTINRKQYGVNIDPYSTDLNYNRDDFHGNRINDTITNYTPQSRPNVSLYEVFNLFESSPRYGIHANLLFQVSFLIFDLIRF